MVFLVTVSLRWLMMTMMAVATYRSPAAIYYSLFNVFFFQFDFLFRICAALARANTHRQAGMHSVRPMALLFFSIGIFIIILFLLCEWLLFIYDFCGSANRVNGRSGVQRAHTAYSTRRYRIFLYSFVCANRKWFFVSLAYYNIIRWMRSVPCRTTVRQIKHLSAPAKRTVSGGMNEFFWFSIIWGATTARDER